MGNLPNLKDLDKLIALCRRRGITSIEFDGLKLTLGEPKPISRRRSRNTSKTHEDAPGSQSDLQIESDTPGHEEMLYWSAGLPNE